MSVSSVKNLNGEVFSAVQDASLTNVVQTNSASWEQGGGTTYTGDAQGALDEVYANSAEWNKVSAISGKYWPLNTNNIISASAPGIELKKRKFSYYFWCEKLQYCFLL
jgi:hypothetical protein